MSLCCLALLLAASPPSSAFERALGEHFERAGRAMPSPDEPLSRAAQSLAEHALAHGMEEATGLLRVTAAISQQHGWDPNPVIIALRGPSPTSLLEELRKQELTEAPASHFGLGLAQSATKSALIVILSRRRIELSAFAHLAPRAIRGQRLCGRLLPPLQSAEVFITDPQGTVLRRPMPQQGAQRCASLDLVAQGRHTVEVLATGPRGPEVAALFFVDVGTPLDGGPTEWRDEPVDLDTAQRALLQRINALRLQHSLSLVESAPVLVKVAQAWATRLANEQFLTHVAPDGDTLRHRLEAANYAFDSAGENLGLSSGPLAAHFGIEHSPGHRSNLLEPGHRHLGIGLAQRADGLWVLVEVLASPRALDSNPREQIYETLATQRAQLGLPSLAIHPVLQALAQQHAQRAMAADLPQGELPGFTRLPEQAFAALAELSGAASDVFVSESPRIRNSTQNLRSSQNQLVGVGLVKGSTPRFGRDRYWVVVLYGATGAPEHPSHSH